jgi:hypothetical protein
MRDGEVRWDWRADDEIARRILHAFYQLPDTIGAGVAALLEGFGEKGQLVMMRDNGELRPATPAELGLT